MTAAALRLEWTAGHVWKGAVSIPKDYLTSELELRAVVLQGNLAMELESPSKVLHISQHLPTALNAPGPATVTCDWQWN